MHTAGSVKQLNHSDFVARVESWQPEWKALCAAIKELVLDGATVCGYSSESLIKHLTGTSAKPPAAHVEALFNVVNTKPMRGA